MEEPDKEKLLNYHQYENTIKRFLVLSGLWPNDHPIALRILLGSIPFMLSFAISYGQLNFCLHAPSMNQLTNAFGSALGIIFVMVRVNIEFLN